MAIVRKCDICSDTYDKYHNQTIMDLYVSEGENKNRYECGMYTEITNCCPSCTERILAFVNVMKNSKKYTG